ncbi:hypothetical protein RP726_15455 [Candidatus Methylospira mobilis]|uniref:hypothetical protein n=1 Tax=Candidatus Methylospira mobilis TaxID=1808979 RepID=UPI001884D587|nr:hypothetical protein [Candidatus Methylospira mobilis]WNV03820.1 hypothetical protein RP726_15455 [Candidatus Methylospira mobilis]
MPLAVMTALVLTAAGCSKTVVPKNPASEEAAIRMETSRREYRECRDAPGQPSCAALERLYDKDRKAYEDSLK